MKKHITLFLALFLFFGMQVSAQFKQAPLDYSYESLEPYIDAKTMEIHYSKHHAGYVSNLNKAIAGTDAEKKDMKDILKHISKYSTAVRNNAGGHYNHDLFWSILTPEKGIKASKKFSKAVEETFGDMETLKSTINSAAATRFGSGWAWLIVTPDGKLAVSSTPNQDNPLMDIAEEKGIPVLGIDVWEHAYYLKYQNKRGDYLSSIWSVINWEEVSKRYEKAVK